MSDYVSTSDFIQSLPPVIEKKALEDALSLARSIIDDSLDEVGEIYRTNPAANKVETNGSKGIDTMLKRLVREGNTPTERLLIIKDKLKPNVTVVEKALKNHIPSRIPRDHLTFKQAGIIKLVHDLRFATEYSMSLIQFINTLELAKLQKVKPEDLVNKWFLKNVEDGLVEFVSIIPDMIVEPKALETTINELAEMTISGVDLKSVLAVHGGKSINPFKANFIGTTYNPIKMILMAIARANADRFHRTREQVRMYENQLALIDQLRKRNGVVDPMLEQEAKELTALIEDLNFEIDRLEKKYD